MRSNECFSNAERVYIVTAFSDAAKSDVAISEKATSVTGLVCVSLRGQTWLREVPPTLSLKSSTLQRG